MDVLKLTKSLISIPSVTGDKTQCDRVLDIAKKELHGFHFEEFEKDGVKSILFFNREKQPGKFRLILNGHLDVVPANPEQFKPYEKDGRLYGRGSQDMKSGAAAIIAVFRELAKNISYPLGLQLVTDEEVGGFKGAKFQLEQGVTTDFMLAAESTDLRINNYAKGPLWLKLNVKGKSAHGAYLWEGKNAIDILRQIMNDMRQEFPEPTEEVWKTTLNIANISTSNTAQNKVPSDAQATFDIRIIPEDRENFLDRVKQIIRDRAEITVMADEPCQITPDNHPDILALRKIAKEITGKEPEYLKTHGGSDVRFYTNTGAGAICFGPTGGGLHTENEWVDIKSIQTFMDILKAFMTTL